MQVELKPVLKWAGGKRWLAAQLPDLLAKPYQRIVEPFAGGAAVFFALQPPAAWLNDLNADLINVYKAIKNDCDALEKRLSQHQKFHSKSYYYAQRSSKQSCPLERAANFIYLNRTCFNGLYRVNQRGEFNVPIGTKSQVFSEGESFASISRALKHAKLTTGDFEKVVDDCGKGDFIYVDPPYTVKHNLNGFIKYNEKLFSWDDQLRLKACLLRAKKRGAQVVISNADHASIRDLYSASESVSKITRHSVMAASSSNRKATSELLVSL